MTFAEDCALEAGGAARIGRDGNQAEALLDAPLEPTVGRARYSLRRDCTARTTMSSAATSTINNKASVQRNGA